MYSTHRKNYWFDAMLKFQCCRRLQNELPLTFYLYYLSVETSVFVSLLASEAEAEVGKKKRNTRGKSCCIHESLTVKSASSKQLSHSLSKALHPCFDS